MPLPGSFPRSLLLWMALCLSLSWSPSQDERVRAQLSAPLDCEGFWSRDNVHSASPPASTLHQMWLCLCAVSSCWFQVMCPGKAGSTGANDRRVWFCILSGLRSAQLGPSADVIWLHVSLLKITATENQAKGSEKLQGQSLTSLWAQPRKALKMEFSAGILGAPLPGISPKGEKSRMWTKMNPVEFIYKSKNLETI